MPKIRNYRFATYHLYHKKKLGIIEFIYNLCLFYKFDLLEIVKMQTNNILILANNNFTNNKENIIKEVKIIIKDYKYLSSAQPIKFNRVQIKLDSNTIIFIKKSQVNDIFLAIGYNIDLTSFRKIIRKKLLLKEQCLAQRAKSAYIGFM